MLGQQLPQYNFADVQVDDAAKKIVLLLKRREDEPYICSKCGQSSLFYYDILDDRCIDHDQKNVLHMIEGRKRGDVEAFFEAMGKEWCNSVEED